jgi:7,8-dihydro-6-hydroxymethylpterin-pyrophosphokinase
LAGSELTGWSMRRKSGTAPSTFALAMPLPNLHQRLSIIDPLVEIASSLRSSQ